MTPNPVSGASNLSIDAASSGRRLRITLGGALDADAAPLLATRFEQWIESGQVDLDIDLRAVGMISSAGIGSLIAGVGEARDEGGTVRVVAMSEAARHVFEMLDLIEYLECPVSAN